MQSSSLQNQDKAAKTEDQARADLKRVLSAFYFKDEMNTTNGGQQSSNSTEIQPGSDAMQRNSPEASMPSPKTVDVARVTGDQATPATRRSSRITRPSLKAREASITDTPTRRGRGGRGSNSFLGPLGTQLQASAGPANDSSAPNEDFANASAPATTLAEPSGIASSANKDSANATSSAGPSGNPSSADEDSANATPSSDSAGPLQSTNSKPADATLDEPWDCANRDCSTGQTWKPRDGAAGYGRKVISNFFGRNKKATNSIDNDVWHNYCRKCYQRDTYNVNKLSAQRKCSYYLDNIRMQLDRLELWRPDAVFTVRLSKGAMDRLHEYWKHCRTNNGDEAAAARAVTRAPQSNGKGKPKPLNLEEAFPVRLMDTFNTTFCDQPAKDYDEIRQILDWTTQRVANGETEHMPSMEFLMSAVQQGETVNNPSDNFARWAALEDAKQVAQNNTAAANSTGSNESQDGANGEDADVQDEADRLIGATSTGLDDQDEDIPGEEGAKVKVEDPTDTSNSVTDEQTEVNDHDDDEDDYVPIKIESEPIILPSIETNDQDDDDEPEATQNEPYQSEGETTISAPSEPSTPPLPPKRKLRLYPTKPGQRHWAPSSCYPGAFTPGDGRASEVAKRKAAEALGDDDDDGNGNVNEGGGKRRRDDDAPASSERGIGGRIWVKRVSKTWLQPL